MERPPDYLRIKVALDTQILAYLVDNTYPNITAFIKKLSESDYVDLVCSRFSIYEFIGIRKLEHYLRCLVEHTRVNGGNLNLSSAIKYKSEFDSPELKYLDTFETVKEEVEKELKRIYEDYGVEYEQINIHNNLWKPHQDLVLTTKISKEDSLLMLSCIFPDTLQKESHLVMLTNDDQFYKSVRGGEKEIELSDKVFEESGLSRPHLYRLREMKIPNDETLNLTESEIDDAKLTEFTKGFIIEQIKEKNKNFLLGEVINCACNNELKKKLLCFRLSEDKELIEGMYISILAPDFTTYSHSEKLSNFKCWGDITLPYKSGEDAKSREISIELTDSSGANIEEDLMTKITAKGSLVLIHPDSFL